MGETGRYALEIPYSKQNYNFKHRITRLGRDLIIVGLTVCLLRSGYVSQSMNTFLTSREETRIESSWIGRWSMPWRRTPQMDHKSWLKTNFPWLANNLPDLPNVRIPREVIKRWEWTVRRIESHTQNAINWVEMVENNLPDVATAFLTIGCFLFLGGTTLILKHNWAPTTTCLCCLPEAVKDNGEKEVSEEETAVRDVELAMPIFRFIKVFPYHKTFPGTSDFSLKSVKMKLVIQFNKSTQT